MGDRAINWKVTDTIPSAHGASISGIEEHLQILELDDIVLLTVVYNQWSKLRRTECAVCRDHLLLGYKMQELPCLQLFHPNYLKSWLDEHTSCPICRHELQTNDHGYESWNAHEKEAGDDRIGTDSEVE
ncbi:E3 ubiquitin-protein ligase AIP2-like [Aristolochia californica]|uniref:E3 ubiquitin-protein ligase AIP2-like n=1 Tax=Aristolochia californica TaxID=171875 RepID=UPI0035DE9008